jgi:hypothetical protein
MITMPPPNIRFRMKNGHVVVRNGRPVPLPGSTPDAPQPARAIGIVPDGVAAVRFGDVTVPVRDNAFEATIRPGGHPRQELLDRSGHPWHGG